MRGLLRDCSNRPLTQCQQILIEWQLEIRRSAADACLSALSERSYLAEFTTGVTELRIGNLVSK